MTYSTRDESRSSVATVATDRRTNDVAMLLKRAFVFAAAVTLTLVLVGCNQEARSETDVPTAREVPELTERADLTSAVAPIDEEARWAEDGFPIDGENTLDEVAVSRALRPTDTRPQLVATDQGGGQIIEVEPAEGVERSSDPYEGLPQPIETAPAEPIEEVVEAPEPAIYVAAGQELVFTVESELSTEHSLPGDVFYAYLVDDLVAPDGLVLLPRGLRARGQVVDVRKSEDSEEMPVLELSIDELIGERDDTPVLATVVHAELEGDARDSDSESVVKVLTGAAAGAILGRILGGDDEDAVKGGVAGAAAGAAVAYGTRGGHAKLPAGAHIIIRLEQPLTVF